MQTSPIFKTFFVGLLMISFISLTKTAKADVDNFIMGLELCPCGSYKEACVPFFNAVCNPSEQEFCYEVC